MMSHASHKSLEVLLPSGARWSLLAAMFLGGGLVSTSATAQFATGFENQPYIGSGAGIALNGQDGFYLPAAGGLSFDVHTYAGNTLGLLANPTGGLQFVGGPPTPGAVFIRSQRDMNFGGGVWRISHDFAATFIGVLPATQNLGSVSLVNSVDLPSFVGLARWSNPNTATRWNADYQWSTAAGNVRIESVPDSRFQNLLINNWYRWSTVVNFDTNEILEVSITDISGGGGTATHNPVDRYLVGGSAGGSPLPTGFRLFTGGSGAVGAAGNTTAFDNLSIAPEPSANLRASLSGPSTPVRSGTTVPVYLRLDNFGPGDAYRPTIEFTSSAPAGSIAVTPPSGWICDGDGAVFVCMAGDKMARGTTRFVFQVTPPANPPGGFVTINASVSSASVDSVPGNNSASFKLYVKPSGGLISPVAPSTR